MNPILSNKSFQIVHHLDEAVWRSFIQKQAVSNIFHTPEMFKVFSQTPGHQPQLWAAIDKAGQVLALLLPVQIVFGQGILRPLTTRAVVYGSVLYDSSSVGEAALGCLLECYREQVSSDVLFTELRNLTDLGTIQQTLHTCSFKLEDHLNFLIKLHRPAEEVLQSIGSRTRKKIRKGLREKTVCITEVKSRDDLDSWYHTLQKTYQSAQVPLANRALFEAAFAELYPRNMIKFLVARVDGAVAACSAELIYKDTIYGWYSGVDRDYSRYYPNEMLTWHILEWGAENGYRVYDFGGAGKPDEEYGVRDFKAKFGGDLVNFGRNISVHAPYRLKLSKLGYRLYQRLLY